jgi:hypothetical protein
MTGGARDRDVRERLARQHDGAGVGCAARAGPAAEATR